jgi:hypothetical protein
VKPEAGGQPGSSNGTSQPQQAAAADAQEQGRSGSPTWEGSSTGDEEADWVGQKPFSWRDIDWGECLGGGGLLTIPFKTILSVACCTKRYSCSSTAAACHKLTCVHAAALLCTGLATLVGGILLLSFGAYRVLNYFSEYSCHVCCPT